MYALDSAGKWVKARERECETRTVKGTTVTTFYSAGSAVLVRTARAEYECDDQKHDDTIARGDVYVEWLGNGSRETGARYCLTSAVEQDIATVTR